MKLTIHAIEGGSYVVNLSDDGRDKTALRAYCARHGVRYEPNMRFRSLGSIRDYFLALQPLDVCLVHNNAYDEMIGLNEKARSYSQPLYWYSRAEIRAS